MELTLIYSKRKFYLTEEQVQYIMKLLSHDISFTTHNMLLYYDTLEADDCSEIGSKIQELMYNNTIYEYYTDNRLIPVINPEVSLLNTGFVFNPISNESLTFLSQVSEFLSNIEGVFVN